MALESLQSGISSFLRHLRNQWPWIPLRGHSRSCILAAIESPCTTLYRSLIVTFTLSSTVSQILPVLYAKAYCVCKQVSKEVSAWAHEYVGLIDIMHPTTLHGVGVITKPYFSIFVAFKESITLNLAQRSFKVIDFGTNRKRIYIFLLVVNSNLDPTLHRFRDTTA